MASTAVVTAIGCDGGGWRRVLGVSVAGTESYDSWLAFLRRVRERGVSGVRLVTSDAHPGLVRAAGEVFRGAAWQRCAVHLMRDCAREAGSRQLRRRVLRIVAPVFRGRGADEVRAMHHLACETLDEDDAWSRSRRFSEARMAELRAPGGEPPAPPSPEESAELRLVVEQAIRASLELADRMETA